MADLSSFLDGSEDDDSDVDIQYNQTSPDTDNAQVDDGDIEMPVNKPTAMNIDSNTSTVVRAEDLFALQAQKDKEQQKDLPSAIIDHQTSLNFDLGHLSCYDPVSINIDELFKHKKDSKPDESKKMPTEYTKLDQTQYEIRKLKEKYLYDMTRQNVQAMVNKLYSLQPIKTGPADDPGLVVKLPPPRVKLPRAKPVSFLFSQMSISDLLIAQNVMIGPRSKTNDSMGEVCFEKRHSYKQKDKRFVAMG